MVDPNRTVHATIYFHGKKASEIARYDRSGKYYIEYEDGGRRQIPLAEAVRIITAENAHNGVRAVFHPNRWGGLRLNAEIRKAQA